MVLKCLGVVCLATSQALAFGCSERSTLPAACASATASSCAPHDDPPLAASVAVSTPLPCEVRQELAAHCWSCHGETLQFTAPMKLVSVEDFLAPARSDPSLSVAQRAKFRIHDPLRPMPPPP